MREKIESVLAVDDEDLFTVILDDALSLTNFTNKVITVNTSEQGEETYLRLLSKRKKPTLVLLDVNMPNSSFDGIELCRRINFKHGNDVVIGMISSSTDEIEQAKAVKAGAQFWLKKSNDIEPRLRALHDDMTGYFSRTNPFKVYKED